VVRAAIWRTVVRYERRPGVTVRNSSRRFRFADDFVRTGRRPLHANRPTLWHIGNGRHDRSSRRIVSSRRRGYVSCPGRDLRSDGSKTSNSRQYRSGGEKVTQSSRMCRRHNVITAGNMIATKRCAQARVWCSKRRSAVNDGSVGNPSAQLAGNGLFFRSPRILPKRIVGTERVRLLW